MARFKFVLPIALLFAGILLITNACGTSPRLLQSVSVSPAIADPKNFPNGQVQFTALGAYNQPPTPAPLSQSGWLLSDSSIATLSQNGLAQCIPGASGQVMVKASVSGPCSGTGCTAVMLSGEATLTCP